MTIPSPCIGVCEARAGVCVGCLRTLAEIAAWAEMSDAERARIMEEELPWRRARASDKLDPYGPQRKAEENAAAEPGPAAAGTAAAGRADRD